MSVRRVQQRQTLFLSGMCLGALVQRQLQVDLRQRTVGLQEVLSLRTLGVLRRARPNAFPQVPSADTLREIHALIDDHCLLLCDVAVHRQAVRSTNHTLIDLGARFCSIRRVSHCRSRPKTDHEHRRAHCHEYKRRRFHMKNGMAARQIDLTGIASGSRVRASTKKTAAKAAAMFKNKN